MVLDKVFAGVREYRRNRRISHEVIQNVWTIIAEERLHMPDALNGFSIDGKGHYYRSVLVQCAMEYAAWHRSKGDESRARAYDTVATEIKEKDGTLPLPGSSFWSAVENALIDSEVQRLAASEQKRAGQQ